MRTLTPVQALVWKKNESTRRIMLSYWDLDATPGDMMRDPQMVYKGAEEMALVFKQRRAAEASWAAHSQDYKVSPGPWHC